MKFKLTSVDFWIDEETKIKYEKYGLKFKLSDKEYEQHGKYQKDYENEDVFIEINSLKEMMDLIKDVGCIVLDKESIEIYDDYRE